MSATGTGLTQISNVNLAAGGAAGSQLNFTHNLGVRAVQVYCSDAVTGRQLDGTEISVAQPTANVVQVANVTTGAVVVNVSIRWQYDSVEENAVAATDARIAAAVGPPPVAAGIVGGGAANQVTYWTGAAAIAGNAFLTTNPATGDLTRIRNVPYAWPAANAVGVLTNDGAGGLTWAPAGGGGANTALSNLAAVAVNADLDPGTDNTRDFGTAALRWRELWIGTSVRVRNNTADTLSLNAGATFDITADVDLAIDTPNLTINSTQAAGILAINAGGQLIATVGNDIQLTPAATFNVAIGLDGTALLPSLTFGTVADPDTGIFHPAAGTLAISTAGVERSRWSSNGDVTLAGGTGANTVLWDQATGSLQVGGNAFGVGPATVVMANSVAAVNNLGNVDALTVQGAPLALSSDGATPVTVTTSSLVATFSADIAMQLEPGNAAALSAAGTGRFRYNGATSTLQFSNNGGAYQSFMGALASLTGGRVTLSSSATTVADSANLTFNGTVLAVNQDGTVALPSITLGSAADPDTGIFHPAANELAITSGGSERLRTRLTAAANQGRVEVNAGTLSVASEYAFLVNATAQTSATASIANGFITTGVGSAAGQQYSLFSSMAAGYTGAASTYAGFFSNGTAGTAGAGINWFAVTGSIALQANSTGNVQGVSLAIAAVAAGANANSNNYGLFARASGAAIVNIGVIGIAIQATTQIGGFFSTEYEAATPNFSSTPAIGVLSASLGGSRPLFVGANGASLTPVFRVEGDGRTRVMLDGAVGTPALTFGTNASADTDTGLWHPAANTLAFSNNAAETMRLTSTNDVGIGVTPTERLSLKDHAAFTSSETQLTTGAVQTTNATVTTVKQVALLASSACWIEADVVGRRTDDGARAYYKLTALVYRVAGVAILEGVTALTTIESDAAWNATVAVTGNDFIVTVTGVAATTINWACTVRYQQVATN